MRLTLCALVLSASSALADDFMHVTHYMYPPVGHVAFCNAHPNLCKPQPEKTHLQISAKNLGELDQINRLVNEAIKPATDRETYGVDEYWELPKRQGDCEDYALLKQQMLLAIGWPQSSLLLTIVFDDENQAHTVLTAHTDKGDFILDNKSNELRLWHQFPYRFVMRQSILDPAKWYSLE